MIRVQPPRVLFAASIVVKSITPGKPEMENTLPNKKTCLFIQSVFGSNWLTFDIDSFSKVYLSERDYCGTVNENPIYGTFPPVGQPKVPRISGKVG